MEQAEQIRAAVRGIVADADGAVPTPVISEALGLSHEDTVEHLDEMTADGQIVKYETDGGIRWRWMGGELSTIEEANSVRITDSQTGIVSRAGTRPNAMRRLADRIEDYEAGKTVGAQITGIGESELSPGYAKSIDGRLPKYAEKSNKHLYVYVADEGVREIESKEQLNRNHDVLGFAITGQFSKQNVVESLGIDLEWLLEQTPLEESNFPISMYKLLAIHPDYQAQGIGSALASHALAYLTENPPVLTVLWKRENDGNIKLAEELGFERLVEVEAAPTSDRKCPECGFDEICTCTSVIYGWWLD